MYSELNVNLVLKFNIYSSNIIFLSELIACCFFLLASTERAILHYRRFNRIEFSHYE